RERSDAALQTPASLAAARAWQPICNCLSPGVEPTHASQDLAIRNDPARRDLGDDDVHAPVAAPDADGLRRGDLVLDSRPLRAARPERSRAGDRGRSDRVLARPRAARLAA